VPDSGTLLPGNGALVKTVSDPTVYLIANNQKHGFTTLSVFKGLGYKLSSVLIVTAPELNMVAEGSILSDPNSSHLQGTNIEYQGTIYWVGGAFRHPYTSLDIYNSWNIDNDFSTVVPANSSDMLIQVGDPVIRRP
jgi:hypothetical protein